MSRLLAATLLLAAWAAAAHAEPRVVVRAARAWDGRDWISPAVVVLDGPRIASVTSTSRDVPGATVIDVPSAVLTPGLVDLDSALGLSEGRDEVPEAVSLDLRALDGFAPVDAEPEALRRSGVTTAWLALGPAGVLSGAGALVQPAASGQAPSVLARAHGACASLASAARVPDRAPTSLPAQAELLERSLKDLPAFPARSVVRIRVDDSASARMAARVPGAVLVGVPSVSTEIAEWSAAPALVLSGLLGAGSGELRAVVELAPSVARLGFGSGQDTSGPRAIRISASRLVAAGLPPRRALAALTSEAAAIAQLPEGRGALAPGAAADLVLWTGDPLDLASRPLVVWVGGREVLDAR